MMGDLIYRQAALAALDGELTVTGRANVDAVREYAINVYGRIKRLQSAQPEWIPCSKRLPEVGTVCLACGRNRGIYVARLDHDGNRYYWTWLGVTREVKPIAWMPLPERYKQI